MRRRQIVFIVIGAFVAVGLVAGAWQVAYAQGQASARATIAAARSDFAQGRPGGQGGPGGQAGQPGGPGGAGGGARSGGQAPLMGTVGSVTGTQLTLTTDVGPVTVTLGDQTQVRRQMPASASDLKAGDHVVVTGARAADGKVSATSIAIQPAG